MCKIIGGEAVDVKETSNRQQYTQQKTKKFEIKELVLLYKRECVLCSVYTVGARSYEIISDICFLHEV